jgi:uncharacterized OB-fold protein
VSTGADWLLTVDLAPSTDDALAPLYAAAAKGMLSLPHCAGCSLALELEQRVCDGCGRTEVEWRGVEPSGIVHSVTVVHRREPGLVVATAPYPVADVEMASGHRLVLAPVHPIRTPPVIGEPVGIAFRRLGAVNVPAFRTCHRDPSRTEAPQ